MKEEVADTGEPKLAYGIREFCRLHDISASYFYKLEKKGLAPRVVQLGARRLITAEDAAKWRGGLEAQRLKIAGDIIREYERSLAEENQNG